MSEQFWTADEVASASAEALLLAEQLHPAQPDEPSGGHATHRYNTETGRCICGALDTEFADVPTEPSPEGRVANLAEQATWPAPNDGLA